MFFFPTSVQPTFARERRPGVEVTMDAMPPLKLIFRKSFMAGMERRAPTGKLRRRNGTEDAMRE